MRHCLLTALLLVACGDKDPGDTGAGAAADGADGAGGTGGSAVAVVDVPAQALDFGAVWLGDAGEQTLEVANTGDAAVALTVTVSGSGLAAATEALLVPAGAVEPVALSWQPAQVGLFEGTVSLTSDDPHGSWEVAVQGDARGPVLAASTNSWQPVNVGCEGVFDVSLENVGNEPLTVSGLALSDDSALSVSVPGGLPLTVVSGDTTAVAVTHAPLEPGAPAVDLVVTSDDPLSPETVVALPIEGVGSIVTDTWTRPAAPVVDVLFALDRSCSMTDDIYQLSEALPDFFTELEAYAVDYRVSVVVDDDGCINGSALAVDPTSADPAAIAAEMIDLWGSAGANTERQFMLLEAAVHEDMPGGCNDGLVRSAASLHVVGVADEPEQSVRPWSDYVATLRALKANPDDVVVSGIGGEYPSGCPVAPGLYSGMYEASVETGGALYSICDPFPTTLSSLAGLVAGARTALPLSDAPVEDTLGLAIDGVDQATGWTYDASDNAVYLDAPVPAGSTVTVTYAADQGC